MALVELTGLVGLAALLALTGCGTAANTMGGGRAGPAAMARVASEPDGTITETGSGLLYPLAQTWAAAYHHQFPGETVTTASTGSGKGIALASAGQADIGASDAYLSSGDLVKNPNLLNVPLAISAQAIIYNLPGMSQQSHVKLNGTAPLRQLWRHVLVHQLSVDPGRELERYDRVWNDGSLA